MLGHAGMVYQYGVESLWLVNDPAKSHSIGLVGLYIDVFAMFTFFFISGYFIPASIKGKNDRRFFVSKFKRIMIPWIVAVLTLIPAYKTIFLYSRGLPQESWYSYFHFFQRAGADPNFFANDPTQQWLWFLPVLFLFQIAYWVLSKTRLLSLKLSMKTAVILTFVLGLIYSKVISGLGLKGWYYSHLLDFQRERLLVYFMVFLLGTLCYELKIFDAAKRNMKYFIISNVLLAVGLTIYTLISLNFFFNIVYPERNYFYISEQADVIVYYSSVLLTMLTLMHIIIDAFRFYFNKKGRFMEHMNKNSYYVYILHMIVLGSIALLLVNFSIPLFIKYPILAVSTFIASNFLVYLYRTVKGSLFNTK